MREIFSRKIILLFALLLGSLTFLAAGSSTVSALYTNEYIEKNLQYGIASAYNADTSIYCKAYWSNSNSNWGTVAGLRFDGSGNGRLYGAMNTVQYGINGDAWACGSPVEASQILGAVSLRYLTALQQ